MNSRLLSLFIVSLAIPMALRGAAFEQQLTDITWINDTKSQFLAAIYSSNKAYNKSKQRLLKKELGPQARLNAINETIMESGPYTVVLTRVGIYVPHYILEQEGIGNYVTYSIRFAIPNITGPTEIRITERPEGSGNYRVWYRDAQTIEQSRQEALAVMQATHQRLGQEAAPLGGEVMSPGRELIYKQIAEYLFEKGWQQASPIPD